MPIRNYRSFLAVLIVFVLCASFLGARSVQADGDTPTEPPPATQVATEPPAEPPVPTQVATEPPTETPVEATPEPPQATEPPPAEALTQVPDGTEVVVLDDSGNPVPLATQAAADITGSTDPMWCPEGVAPGGAGCSAGYSTISALINNMVSNTGAYTQNGVIYFTSNPGTGTFNLSETSLTGDFDTLKNYSLTLQGGWNGDTVSPDFSGQTDFSNHPITIGSSTNPWVGNLTINDITFTGASQTSLTIFTTSGDITLDNVDVNNQGAGHNTALLDSDSGDITITGGIFDGNGTNSAGLSATTGSGSITISDSSFTENKKPGPTNNVNGATLSAPIVTLSNVLATSNDGNGIAIDNADIVTLNDVVAIGNGTNPPGPVSNDGSGVFIDGNPASNVFINHGTFSGNQEYGIELADPANTTIILQYTADCAGNGSGCSNGSLTDRTAPTLSLPADITVSVANPAGAVVDYSTTATDNVDPTVSVTCSPAPGSTFPVGTTTVDCFASDAAGNTALGSFQVTVIDTTVTPTPPPTPSPLPPASPSSEPSSAGSSRDLIIPVTGGQIIVLDCSSVFWAFGVKLSFLNLCGYQAALENVDPADLPAPLPGGYTFVMGLDLNLLHGAEPLMQLPEGASIQLAFPNLGHSNNQFAVLTWNGGSWVEVPQQTGNDPAFYDVLTTGNTGIFVLVRK